MNNPLLFDETIVNHIRAQSAEIDKTGLISEDILELIYEHGLFKCFLPDFLNGNMKTLPEALRVFEDASSVDGNFGWSVTIGSRGGCFAAYLEPEKSGELYAGRHAVVAGSSFSSGTAKRVAGGYEVSGSWKYCSGSTHATLFTFNCEATVEGNPSRTEIRTFVLRPHQVSIVKDWDAFGLKATASHSVLVENQFVEDAMSFVMFTENQKLHYAAYSYPLKPFSETSFAAIAIGIIRHFFEEAELLAQENREAWETSHLDRYEFVVGRIERSKKVMEATVDSFYQVVEANWEKHVAQKEISSEEWSLIGQTSRRVARVALDCTHSIFPYLGTSVVLEHKAINCIYRDLHTACQNALLVPFNEEELTY
jgi:alkylation response protein AidB-like acyl-CoA dehydrogenase